MYAIAIALSKYWDDGVRLVGPFETEAAAIAHASQLRREDPDTPVEVLELTPPG